MKEIVFASCNQKKKAEIQRMAPSNIKILGLNDIENADIDINLLSPVFTTQGGPGCVAIQYIRKHELLK